MEEIEMEDDHPSEHFDDEIEESDCVPQIHLISKKNCVLIEGAAFKAVRDNNIPILSALIFSGYDINECNDKNEAEGTKAFYDIEDRSRMARSVRIKSYTPLHLAVAHSTIKIIRYLLSNGADVNVRDSNSISPLSLAAAVQRPDVTQLLLRAGALVDSQSTSGRTPLLQAIGNGSLSIVTQLLKAGADPNLMDTKGTTPMFMCLQAPREEQDNVGVMEAVIRYGGLVDLPNKQGATALMLSIGLGRLDMAEVLLKAGANINVRDKAGQGVMHLISGTTTGLFLLHRGATSDWPDNKGVTPLHKAMRAGNLSLISFFLLSDSLRSRDGLLDHPRVAQVRQQVPTFDSWLQQELGSPRSLRRLCRQVVRQCLCPDNTCHIESLPVPLMVKDFLLCRHLELPFYKAKPAHWAATVPTLHF